VALNPWLALWSAGWTVTLGWLKLVSEAAINTVMLSKRVFVFILYSSIHQLAERNDFWRPRSFVPCHDLQ
jgi:hypothetical protein